MFRVRKDGTNGKRTEVQDMPHLRGATEGVLGAMEKPVCRTTEITNKHMSRFGRLLPMARHLQDIYRQCCPEHFQSQDEMAGQIDPSYLLEGTVFSTLTCNRNWATACHIDSGDLKSGRGVLTMFSSGRYTGGELVLPHYRVAVRYGMLDVLIMDNHEVHANLPLVGTEGKYERIVLVCYLRSGLLKRCPSL